MTTIEHHAELRRAGVHSTHGWRRLAFLAQRYLLGTFGLIIMVLFVWMAISADLICRFSPLSVDSAQRLAAPNAVLPVVTIVGVEAAFLIGGLIVTETVFNIPGVARFLVEAIRSRDYPIVQNLVMLIAVVVVVANFTVDMLYAAIDPRIRYGD